MSPVVDDLARIAPMLVLAAWSLLLLVVDAFSMPGARTFQRRVALLGVAIALVLALLQFRDPQLDRGIAVFSGFLVVDKFALLIDIGALVVTGMVLLFAGDYARSHRFEYGEQESLLLIATFGVMTLAHSADLLAVFLGVETMSIAAYVLVGARWNSKVAPEAALKYFLMGAFASGLLLMGMALVYGATGATEFDGVASGVQRVFHEWRSVQADVEVAMHPSEAPASAVAYSTERAFAGIGPAALLFPGLLLILGALLFKVSAVPFHMWTPDAYEGAPTPVTAYMAAAVKLGGFAALLKVLVGVFTNRILIIEPYGWTSVVALVAFATMTVGNFAAVGQPRVKRMLAFSSVAHVGYLLVGVIAAASFYGAAASQTKALADGQAAARWVFSGGDSALAAVLYYLLTYAVATIGCFACIAWAESTHEDMSHTHQWSGLAQRSPAMACGMAVCLLSLMGMPPLAGFVGKLSLFQAALSNDNAVLRWLVVAALLNAVVGAYYYLRLMVAMYFRAPNEGLTAAPDESVARGARVAVGIAAAASLLFGVAAEPVIGWAEHAAAGFTLRTGSDLKGSWVAGAEP